MEALVALPPAIAATAALAFGLIVGSFLNVVVYRLPRGESLVHPRSRCPGCGVQIAARDNVPLVSWLLLGGRCRHCKAPISVRYPAVELLTGILFAAIVLRHGISPMTPVWLAFCAALIAAAAIDFDHRIIPDSISLGGLLLAILLVPGLQVVGGVALDAALLHSLLGAAIGGGSLWLVGFVHARVCVLAGRRFEHWPGDGEELPRPGSLDYWTWFPGVGFGDVKLLAMIGAVLGPLGVLETILAASAGGLILGVGHALLSRSWAAPFGFGPAIALGALVALLVPFDLFRP